MCVHSTSKTALGLSVSARRRTAEEGHTVVGAEEDGVHVGMTPQQLLERRVHARVLLRVRVGGGGLRWHGNTVSCMYVCGTTRRGDSGMHEF